MLQQAQSDNKPHFTPEELAYFKAIGNATIFIHGFEVPEGEYPNAIDALHPDYLPSVAGPNAGVPNDIDIVWSSYKRTFIDSRKLIAQRFGVSEAALPPDLDDEKLNGTGDCNWFIHMENNLNVATNQFDHTDWTKYSRVIGISWPGDVGVVNYIQSEVNADYAATKLYKLIIELHQAGVEINMVAHSMGCRVALSCLNQLGFNNCENYVKHVFLWEAAVPDTALSNDPKLDKTRRQNGAFIYAHKAVEKITVLYCRQDDVLMWPYWMATYIDKTPAQLMHDWGYPERVKNYGLRSQTIAKQIGALLLDNDYRNYYDLTIAEGVTDWFGVTTLFRQPMDQKIFELGKKLTKKYGLHTALGYNGPDMSDPFIQHQVETKKIILADMTPWGVGHSYMRIPNADVMQHGYKTWVINQTYGMKKFGFYDPSKFPNFLPSQQEKPQ